MISRSLIRSPRLGAIAGISWPSVKPWKARAYYQKCVSGVLRACRRRPDKRPALSPAPGVRPTRTPATGLRRGLARPLGAQVSHQHRRQRNGSSKRDQTHGFDNRHGPPPAPLRGRDGVLTHAGARQLELSSSGSGLVSLEAFTSHSGAGHTMAGHRSSVADHRSRVRPMEEVRSHGMGRSSSGLARSRRREDLGCSVRRSGTAGSSCHPRR